MSMLRKFGLGVAATAMAVAGVAVAPTVAQAESTPKVWVCKYVSTPGGGEVLSSGNPISSVGNGQGYKPFQWFTDAQGSSVVAKYDTGPASKPTVSYCNYAAEMANAGAGGF